MNGDVSCATAIASPVVVKATPFPGPAGKVAGLLYLLPKPDACVQAYAITYGDPALATAIVSLALVKTTPVPVLGMAVPGFEYFVPKPDVLHLYASM